ncbi:hypothetical protein WDW89_02715 [Deltaproteobacteria bacterium TL4]
MAVGVSSKVGVREMAFLEIKGNRNIYIHEHGEQMDEVPSHGYWLNIDQFISIEFKETAKEHSINFKKLIGQENDTLITVVSVRFGKNVEESESEFQQIRQFLKNQG